MTVMGRVREQWVWAAADGGERVLLARERCHPRVGVGVVWMGVVCVGVWVWGDLPSAGAL